jgi:hypothetical protein
MMKMDFTELGKYINVLVCGICFCLGVVFKNSCDFMPTKYIPLVMAFSGVVLNVWLNGWKITPEIMLGGLVSGLSSTGAWEALRNTVL